MKLSALLAALFLAVSASAQQASLHGHLVLIGGGDKPRAAMEKFVELAGGPNAPIVIIPTASSEPDAAEYYENLFAKEYGCKDVKALRIKSPADARKPEFVAAATRARGIFFGGGDQLRIVTALDASPVLDALRGAWEHGAAVGGTSAGTACQSRMMLTGEGDFSLIQSRSVEIWNGLGFFEWGIVDQHFIARQRENRLLSAVLEHPDQLGVGVDEDTAIWVRPDGTFQVIGANSVMVIDAAGAATRRKAVPTGRELLGAHDVHIHVLLDGEVFDMKSRSVVPPGSGTATPAGGTHP